MAGRLRNVVEANFLFLEAPPTGFISYICILKNFCSSAKAILLPLNEISCEGEFIYFSEQIPFLLPPSKDLRSTLLKLFQIIKF